MIAAGSEAVSGAAGLIVLIGATVLIMAVLGIGRVARIRLSWRLWRIVSVGATVVILAMLLTYTDISDTLKNTVDSLTTDELKSVG